MAKDDKNDKTGNRFLDAAKGIPEGRAVLKTIGEHAKSGWDSAAANIIDEPIGKEYIKMGVHPERVLQFFEAHSAWVQNGRKGDAPNVKDFSKPVMAPWTGKKPDDPQP